MNVIIFVEIMQNKIYIINKKLNTKLKATAKGMV